MSAPRDIFNRRRGVYLARGARWCASFGSRLRGLMFRRGLAPGEALVLVEARASRANAAIHMWFVPFPIGVIWADDQGRVVDTVVAQPWRPYYAPRAPARYTVEAAPEIVEQVTIGDELVFETRAA